MKALTDIGELLQQTFVEWYNDKAPQLGAALAFYASLSVAPLLVIALGIAAIVFGEDAARGQLSAETRSIVGAEGSDALEEMISSARQPGTGSVAAALSLITLLVGASGVFSQLQDSLNTIWNVKPKPGRGISGFLHDRLLSFAMVLGVAVLLLASLVVSAVLTGAAAYARDWQGVGWVPQATNTAVSFAVVMVSFALIFKILPDVQIGWSDVWLGAAVTAALFTAGKYAIGLYLGYSSMSSSYGVAGSFVVLLVWIYYSAQIVYFGAELTQVYANRQGWRIKPAPHAMWLDECDDNAQRRDEDAAAGRKPERGDMPP